MPGPIKKPTKFINDPGIRKSREGEVQYDEMSKKEITKATKEDANWSQIIDLLHSYGVATLADSPALSLLESTWADYQEALKKCKEEGSYIYNTSGYAQIAPWASQVNKLRDQVLRLLREFGLTPSARSGLQGSKQQESKSADNPLDI